MMQQHAGPSNSGNSVQSDLPPVGQKFVPLWKRALPSPAVQGGSAPNTPVMQSNTHNMSPIPPGPLPNTIADLRPSLQSQAVVGRRGTTSRPLPQSPGMTPQAGPSRGSVPNINSHGQLPNPPNQSPASVPRPGPAPLNSTLSQMDNSVIPSNSPFMRRERSRTLPQPSVASPTAPAMQRPEPIGRSVRTPSTSSDDDLSGISLLQRRSIHKDANGVNPVPTARTPSPQYGIKDMPSRSPQTTPRGQSAGNSNHVRAPSSPTRQRPPLPVRRDTSPVRPDPSHQTTSSSPERVPTLIHDASERQSSIYKFAVMDVLGIKGPESPTKRTQQSNPTPAMRRSQTEQPRWPDDVPKLPRPPAQNMSAPGSSRSTSPSRTSQIRSDLPVRDQSLNNPVANVSFRERQSYHHRAPPNLDDAPPPSLRRSPSPDPHRRAPSGLPNIRTQTHNSWTSPTYGRTPSSAVTPDSAASIFTLSEFPAVPTHAPQPLPPQININSLPQVKSNKGGPRNSPQRHSRSAKREENERPSIPKISFPADPNDSDDSDGPQPVINVSGPDGNSSNPVISIGNFDDDDDDGQFPGISISVADDSTPSQPERPRRAHRDLPPPASVLGKGGRFCGGCGGTIIGRIVSAMGERWHPTCFKCVVCDEHLENLSSYEHEGRPYCHLDYHDMFAPRCYHCQTTIVDEIFITLDDPDLGKRTYHEQHFFCAECGDPFVPPGSGSRSFSGDGTFKADEDDVGFTVYKGHPYCETCHVRLRMPKCQRCKKSIRDGMQAVEALGGKWCWECFTCASCDQPFEDPSFFQRDNKAFCERCFSIMIKNEM
ncbi:hypothetical protein QCA50_020255 [Cerrena zonata]|uniref:LIM zinc-binding domain-containing protein n=1 Tax=Cerrena zonata TaxID=2478898 RepID=A0AAW0FCM0_9APHY